MNEKELLKWAVKGLRAEIDKLEKDVNKGKRFLLEYERGEKPKTTKTPFEIKEIIKQKVTEIEKLDRMKFDLEWELNVEE